MSGSEEKIPSESPEQGTEKGGLQVTLVHHIMQERSEYEHPEELDWKASGPSEDVQYHCYMCHYVPIIKGTKKASRRATKAIAVMNAMSKHGPQSKEQ